MAPGYHAYLLRNTAIAQLAGESSRIVFRLGAVSDEFSPIHAQLGLQHIGCFEKFYRVNYLCATGNRKQRTNCHYRYCQKYFDIHEKAEMNINPCCFCDCCHDCGYDHAYAYGCGRGRACGCDLLYGPRDREQVFQTPLHHGIPGLQIILHR